MYRCKNCGTAVVPYFDTFVHADDGFRLCRKPQYATPDYETGEIS